MEISTFWACMAIKRKHEGCLTFVVSKETFTNGDVLLHGDCFFSHIAPVKNTVCSEQIVLNCSVNMTVSKGTSVPVLQFRPNVSSC